MKKNPLYKIFGAVNPIMAGACAGTIAFATANEFAGTTYQFPVQITSIDIASKETFVRMVSVDKDQAAFSSLQIPLPHKTARNFKEKSFACVTAYVSLLGNRGPFRLQPSHNCTYQA